MKLLTMISVGFAIIWLPLTVHAGKWSDFSVITSDRDVVVSERHRAQKDGWFVEWRVDNKSSDWVEPVAKSRTYVCADGTKQRLEKKTLGPYPPVNIEKAESEIGKFAWGVTSRLLRPTSNGVQYRNVYETCGNKYELA